jgi:hypothetical protein
VLERVTCQILPKFCHLLLPIILSYIVAYYLVLFSTISSPTTMGGYGVSLIGSHGAVSQSVSQSVGWSVGRNQLVGKQSVRRKEKNIF